MGTELSFSGCHMKAKWMLLSTAAGGSSTCRTVPGGICVRAASVRSPHRRMLIKAEKAYPRPQEDDDTSSS
ncbi:hypothetical protein BD309DRAFT_962592 [Dichomitus squalens]|nr:hypothetical protein BD309DRAFT_962592 [Dichomitus squalens]